MVRSAKNKRSIKVSMSSSASGFTSSYSSVFALIACLSASASSNSTSFAMTARRVRFRRVPQKKRCSQAARFPFSYRYGRIRVRTRIQFRASLSGASSGSGKDGWCRRRKSREVSANMSVSIFSSALSLVRRISVGENRLKTS